jgi:hypothetical protein
MSDVNASELRQEVEQILANGKVCRFRYFAESGADAGYDDDVVLTQTGTDYFTSGLVQPIKDRFGSADAILLQQGKILNNDLKLYVLGDVPTSGTFKVGIGSPTIENEYSRIPDGTEQWDLDGAVYKKLYLRVLPTGSIDGE